jgi:hypothetical protein
MRRRKFGVIAVTMGMQKLIGVQVDVLRPNLPIDLAPNSRSHGRFADFHDKSLSRGQELSRRAEEERRCIFFFIHRRV